MRLQKSQPFRKRSEYFRNSIYIFRRNRWNNLKRMGILILSIILLILTLLSFKILENDNNYKNNVMMDSISIIPLSNYNLSVGINDNGSVLINNTIKNYTYGTNVFLGYFAFFGGSFYSGPPVNSQSFSVQLNSNINVTDNMTLWVQDLFLVNYFDNSYYIYIMDNLWNSTSPNSTINQFLVSGNGSFSVANNKIYYFNEALNNENIINYITKPPFYLYAMMNLTLNFNGYPQIYVYYRIKNLTFDSGWILYDIITIKIPSNNTKFLVGNQQDILPNKPNYPFVTQWIVAGGGGGSELFIYNWNASIMLYYKYDGKLYEVPDSISLRPTYFKGGITSENVSQYYGIIENYNNRQGLVYQIKGRNIQKFLWEPHVKYDINGNNLTIYLTPSMGEWQIIISSNNYYNEVLGNYSPLSFVLPGGTYYLSATLYAGSEPIITFTKLFNITIIKISSLAPFYINDVYYSKGNIEFFKIPLNLTIPSIYYENKNNRMVFKYLIVNNKIIKNNTIIINSSSNITVIFQKQYYVIINGIGNWYNEGQTVRIYKSVPIYETLTWVGNYTLPNNSSIVINGSIIESAKILPNPIFIALVLIMAIILSILTIRYKNF